VRILHYYVKVGEHLMIYQGCHRRLAYCYQEDFLGVSLHPFNNGLRSGGWSSTWSSN